MICADVGLLSPPEPLQTEKSRAESKTPSSKEVVSTPSRDTPSLKETPVPSKVAMMLPFFNTPNIANYCDEK